MSDLNREALLLIREIENRLGTQSMIVGPYRKRFSKTYEFVQKNAYLSADSKVGEIGPGAVLAMICEKFSCEGVGFGRMSRQIMNDFEVLNIKTIDYDANTNKISNEWFGYFDCILHLEVIEHLVNWPLDVLNNALRLLKPNGLLFLSTSNICRFLNRARVLIGKSPIITPFEKTKYGKNHIREFTKHEIDMFIKKLNVEISGFEYWQYRLGRYQSALMPLFKIMPSLSSHMLYCVRKSNDDNMEY